MKRNMMWSLFFLTVLSAWCGSAQFTERRTKKGPSMSTLKEQYCQQCADLLKEVPALLHKIATLQEKAVATIGGYWEGDKESFCNIVSRPKLIASVGHLEKVQEKISALCAEVDSCVAELQVA